MADTLESQAGTQSPEATSEFSFFLQSPSGPEQMSGW